MPSPLLLSASQAEEGSLQVKPLKLVPLEPTEGLSWLPTSAHVTISAASTTRSTKLGDLTLLVAPLSRLYGSRIHVLVEFPDKSKYRGTYCADELPVHQTALLSIPLFKKEDDALATSPERTAQTLALRVECKLQGPCRSAKAKQAFHGWLSVVDKVEDTLVTVWNQKIPNAVKKKQLVLLLVPATFAVLVPVVTVCVVASPFVIGFSILFFPLIFGACFLFSPLIVGAFLLAVVVVLGAVLVATVLCSSSRHGRLQLGSLWQKQTTLQKYWNLLTGPKFQLQTVYYATGPIMRGRTKGKATEWPNEMK